MMNYFLRISVLALFFSASVVCAQASSQWNTSNQSLPGAGTLELDLYDMARDTADDFDAKNTLDSAITADIVGTLAGLVDHLTSAGASDLSVKNRMKDAFQDLTETYYEVPSVRQTALINEIHDVIDLNEIDIFGVNTTPFIITENWRYDIFYNSLTTRGYPSQICSERIFNAYRLYIEENDLYDQDWVTFINYFNSLNPAEYDYGEWQGWAELNGFSGDLSLDVYNGWIDYIAQNIVTVPTWGDFLIYNAGSNVVVGQGWDSPLIAQSNHVINLIPGVNTHATQEPLSQCLVTQTYRYDPFFPSCDLLIEGTVNRSGYFADRPIARVLCAEQIVPGFEGVEQSGCDVSSAVLQVLRPDGSLYQEKTGVDAVVNGIQIPEHGMIVVAQVADVAGNISGNVSAVSPFPSFEEDDFMLVTKPTNVNKTLGAGLKAGSDFYIPSPDGIGQGTLQDYYPRECQTRIQIDSTPSCLDPASSIDCCLAAGNSAEYCNCHVNKDESVYPNCTCGDGIMQDHEQCDDGNDSNEDSCDNSCNQVISYTPSLVLEKRVNNTSGISVEKDEFVLYEIIITNNGSEDLKDVVVKDFLSTALLYDGAIDDGIIYDNSTHSVAVDIDYLLAGESLTKGFWVQVSLVNPGSIVSNLATGTGTGVYTGLTIDPQVVSNPVVLYVVSNGAPICGNGRIEFEEECDDGNTLSGDGCSQLCHVENLANCGNQVVDPGEECDDGNTLSGDGCNRFCSFEHYCGNNVVDTNPSLLFGGLPEACDDGNTSNADNCSFPTCQVLATDVTISKSVFPFSGSRVNRGEEVSYIFQIKNNSTLPQLLRLSDVIDQRLEFVEIKHINNLIPEDFAADTFPLQFDYQFLDGGLEAYDFNYDLTDNSIEVEIGYLPPGETFEISTTWRVKSDADYGQAFNQATLDRLDENDNVIQSLISNQTILHTVESPAICGNGLIDGGETCDDGNSINGDGCSQTCQYETACGDGVLDTSNAEQCDDGNLTDGDGCSVRCTIEACGNNIIDAGEECDDGNSVSADGCNNLCEIDAYCGDNEINIDKGETCDDGNLEVGDGCNTQCQTEVCGNNIIDIGEECDDGNITDGDQCSSSCTSEICGNGTVDAGEQCDDGNNVSGDSCSSACQIEICGNGTVDAGEQCDDGNNVSGDSCSSACQIEICGNGTVDAGEQCDDGNNTNADGCGSTCQTETCGNGILDPNEQCDDNNIDSGDGCDNLCRVEYACGNGLIDGGETCDDGNRISGDGCSTICAVERYCGNGVIETDLGETCDDANLLNNDGCSATCRDENISICGDGMVEGIENCDLGDQNGVPGSTCSSQCITVGSVCGNNVVETGEACDGGANCLSDCTLAGGGSPELYCSQTIKEPYFPGSYCYCNALIKGNPAYTDISACSNEYCVVNPTAPLCNVITPAYPPIVPTEICDLVDDYGTCAPLSVQLKIEHAGLGLDQEQISDQVSNPTTYRANDGGITLYFSAIDVKNTGEGVSQISFDGAGTGLSSVIISRRQSYGTRFEDKKTAIFTNLDLQLQDGPEYKWNLNQHTFPGEDKVIFSQAGLYQVMLVVRDNTGNTVITPDYWIDIKPGNIDNDSSNLSNQCQKKADGFDPCNNLLNLRDKYDNEIRNRSGLTVTPRSSASVTSLDMNKFGEQAFYNAIRLQGSTDNKLINQTTNENGAVALTMTSLLPSLEITQNPTYEVSYASESKAIDLQFDVTAQTVDERGNPTGTNQIFNPSSPIQFYPLVEVEVSDQYGAAPTGDVDITPGEDLDIYLNARPNLNLLGQATPSAYSIKFQAIPNTGFVWRDQNGNSLSSGVEYPISGGHTGLKVKSLSLSPLGDSYSGEIPKFGLFSLVSIPLDGQIVTYPTGVLGVDVPINSTPLFPITTCSGLLPGSMYAYCYDISLSDITADIEGGGAIGDAVILNFDGDAQVDRTTSVSLASADRDAREDFVREAYKLLRGKTPNEIASFTDRKLVLDDNFWTSDICSADDVIYFRGTQDPETASIGRDLIQFGSGLTETANGFDNVVSIGAGCSGQALQKTIVVEDANVLVNHNFKYENSQSILGIIVLNSELNPRPNVANIFVDRRVNQFVGAFFADGGLISVDYNGSGVPPTMQTMQNSIDRSSKSDMNAKLNRQLVIDGALLTYNTYGGSMVEDIFDPWSELSNQITDKKIARLYDLHFVRRYGGAEDTSLCTPDYKLVDVGLVNQCNTNKHAFVIKLDNKVNTTPPPGFEQVGSFGIFKQ